MQDQISEHVTASASRIAPGAAAALYIGTTELGDSASEDSLAACVESMAMIAGHKPSQAITRQTGPDNWQVYAGQAELDAELERQIFTESDTKKYSWFAVIRVSWR
jgi:hypothetical protein